MKYLEFADARAAHERSRAVLEAQPGWRPGNATGQMFEVREQADKAGAILAVPDGDDVKLDAEDRAALLDEDAAEARGWRVKPRDLAALEDGRVVEREGR